MPLSVSAVTSPFFPYQFGFRYASSPALTPRSGKSSLTTLSQFIPVALHKLFEILNTIKARMSVYLEQTAHSQFVLRSSTRGAIVLRAENRLNPRL